MSAKNEFATPKNDYIALKNVLFGRESAVLEDIRALVQFHNEKIGSPDQLRESVAGVLAGALRGAGLKDRPGLASSLAPLIIDGIKNEIRNSRDEIVEALYPIIGRLTSAYVMSVFRDFMEETNKRLEGSLSGRFLWLRLQCLLTGKSYAQALLQRQTAFRVLEIMLIDAQTGALLESWDAPDLALDREAIANKGPRVTAMLAAVNKFAAEALKAKRQSLKSIDLGDSQIYLRMTAKFLFAVRCEGSARASLINTLDKTIVDVLEIYEPGLNSSDSHTAKQSASETLAALAERVQGALTVKRKQPVLAIALFGAISALILGYSGWSFWKEARLTAIHHRAELAATTFPGAQTYPVEVSFNDDKTALILSGMVPSEAARDGIKDKVAREAGEMAVKNHLLVLPDVRTIEALQNAVEALTAKISDLTAKTDSSAAELKESLRTQAESLHAQTEGLRAVTAEVFSPRQRFISWARSNAIFFGEGAQFRYPDMAARQLKEAASLLNDLDLHVLILGFTDALGPKGSNLQLGAERAKIVAQELMKLGVSSSQLSLVSRTADSAVSSETGATSANRRVEFQLDFLRE